MKPRIKSTVIEYVGKQPLNNVRYRATKTKNVEVLTCVNRKLYPMAQTYYQKDTDPTPYIKSTSCWQLAGNYKGAHIMPLVGSGEEKPRDNRHPDLKLKKPKGDTGAGLPNDVVRKYGHHILTLDDITPPEKIDL
jgi:hypothetical protein